MSKKVLVIGAGIGGLGAVTALTRQGIEAEAIDIRPDSSVLGVGINQPGNSLRALDLLGVLEECLDVGYAFDRFAHHDWQGQPIVETISTLGTDRVPGNNGLSRGDLQGILVRAADRAGATVTWGTTVVDLVETAGGVEVTLSDGRQESYDAVVAFDGIRSPMRKELFGTDFDPAYTGYGVTRVTLPRPADVTHLVLYHGDRTSAGVIPMSADSMYLFRVGADPEGARHAPDTLDDYLREGLVGYGGLIGELAGALPPADQIVYSPLREVSLPAPWHAGRRMVLGDAAHASAPNLTQGAAMALEDAIVLADELAVAGRSVAESLATVTALRFPRAKLVQDVSHGILTTEMSVTAADLAGFGAGLREHLPANTARIEGVLNQSFRRDGLPS